MKTAINIQQLQRYKIVDLLQSYTDIIQQELVLINKIDNNSLDLEIDINSNGTTTTISFLLSTKLISINITLLNDYTTISQILKSQNSDLVPDSICYNVVLDIYGKPNTDVMVTEYLMYKGIFKAINDFFLVNTWDYIQFSDLEGKSAKLYHAIAQHMTCKQANVERFAHYKNLFLISKF